MKKSIFCVLGAIFGFLSLQPAWSDVTDEVNGFLQNWVDTQKAFAESMGRAETNEQAAGAADKLIQALKTLQGQAEAIKTKYTEAQDTSFDAVYAQTWNDFKKKNSEVYQMFTIAVIKFTKFVKKDSTLSDRYDELSKDSQSLKPPK